MTHRSFVSLDFFGSVFFFLPVSLLYVFIFHLYDLKVQVQQYIPYMNVLDFFLKKREMIKDTCTLLSMRTLTSGPPIMDNLLCYNHPLDKIL